MDSGTGDHWTNLANSLSDHSDNVQLRVRAGVPKKSPVDCGITVCPQSCGEPGLHTNSVWHEKSTASDGRHRNRVGHDHLDVGGDLEVLSLSGRGSDPVFHLGFVGNCLATVDNGDELAKVVIRLALTYVVPATAEDITKS